MPMDWSYGDPYKLGLYCNSETRGQWNVILNDETLTGVDKIRIILDTNPDKCGTILDMVDGSMKALGPGGKTTINYEGSGGLRIKGTLDQAKIYYKGNQMGRVQSIDLQHRSDSPLTTVNMKLMEVPAKVGGPCIFC